MYGAEAVILNLMHTIRNGPHASALCVFRNGSQPDVQLYERARAEGLETYSLECRGQLDRKVPQALRNLVRRTGADVLHAHGYKADVYLYLAARKLNIAAVSTCHTWYDNNLSLRLYGALDRYVLRSYSAVAAVSEEVRQRLLQAGVSDERVTLIRNGVDLRPFTIRKDQTAPDQPLHVGLVGRLDREKGIDLFLRAAAGVLVQLPLTRFTVVGDGPDRDKLQALIGELGISKNAFLLGRQENMPSYYSTLDLMVSSSRQEGLPMALLEGMASGLPLVAAAVGAVPGLVHDGVTGSLVAAEDVPALTRAMLDLLRDPAKRNRFGAAARGLVEQDFSAERMTADYVKFYEQAAQRRNRQAG